MARYDKYNPISGGFRAPLEAALTSDDVGVVVGVGLNASGRVVPGAGATGIVGVICPTQPMAARDIVDVMTDGEIVDMEGVTAGTMHYAAAADGALGTTNTDTRIGHTVEATRLIVRAAR